MIEDIGVPNKYGDPYLVHTGSIYETRIHDLIAWDYIMNLPRNYFA